MLALQRQQVMPLRDSFFNLISNITNPSFPRSMPRSRAVDEYDHIFPKAPKISQMLPFCTPFYPTVMTF
jgi:hypothetical protein